MHPHLIPHIIHVGGIPAGIGAVLGGVLSFPQKDASGDLLALATYHNELGGSGMALEAAVATMVGCAIVGALIGLAIGYLLIATGVVEKKDMGIDE